MKKLIIAAMLLLLCWAVCIGACAVEARYVDEISGIQFELPEGWDGRMYSSGDVYKHTYFYPVQEEDPMISFSVLDIYKETILTDIKQMLSCFPISRKNYDNNWLSTEKLALYFGFSEDEISELMLGGRTYFHLQIADMLATYEIPAGNYLLRMENGFLYMFSFDRPSTHPRYDDFLAMVADAEYPIYSMDEKTSILWELLIVLVSFVLHCLPIVIFRYGIKKAPLENAKEVSIIYGIGAVLAGWVVGGFLEVANIGVCAVGIAIGAVVNYRVLSK